MHTLVISEAEALTMQDLDLLIIDPEAEIIITEVPIIIGEEFLLTIIDVQELLHTLEELDPLITEITQDQDLLALTGVVLDQETIAEALGAPEVLDLEVTQDLQEVVVVLVLTEVVVDLEAADQEVVAVAEEVVVEEDNTTQVVTST